MQPQEAAIAVRDRVPLSFLYQKLPRMVCAHMLGVDKNNRLVLHCFQFGGETSAGRIDDPKAGGWKFFFLDQIQGWASVGLIGKRWYPEPDPRLLKGEKVYFPPKHIVKVLALAPQ